MKMIASESLLTNQHFQRSQSADAHQFASDLVQVMTAQEISGVGSWEMCVQSGEMWISPQASAILGRARNKPCLNQLLENMPESDRLRLLEAYCNCLKSDACVEIEHALIAPDGSHRQIRQRMRWIPDVREGYRHLIGTIQDVTCYKATSYALRESERKFRLLMANAPYGIALLDESGNFMEVNDALCVLLGYTPIELIGQNFQNLTHPEDLSAWKSSISEMFSSGRNQLHFENRCMRKDGTTVWLDVRLNAQHDEAGAISLMFAHIQDLTARKLEEAEIRRQVHIDPLTGLSNRRMLIDRLEFSWNQAQRYNRSFAIIYLDLDDFKTVNDHLGHATGDLMLIEVARRLLDCTRASDTVARLGGDEFVILLSEVDEQSAPASIADKILNALSVPFLTSGHQLAPRASMGIVSFPTKKFCSPGAMLDAADNAMYTAKRTGGGRYHLGHQDEKAERGTLTYS